MHNTTKYLIVRNLLILSILLLFYTFDTLSQKRTFQDYNNFHTSPNYHFVICISKNCVTATNPPATFPISLPNYRGKTTKQMGKSVFNNTDSVLSYQFLANSFTIEKPTSSDIREHLNTETDNHINGLKSELEKNIDASSLEKGNLKLGELDIEDNFQESVNPIKEIHIDRKNLNAVKKVNEKVLHLKKEKNSAFRQYFKSPDLEKWYHHFTAFASIDVVDPRALLTENALGLRWAYSKNISLGFSYGIRTQTKISTDTLLIRRRPVNTLNIFTEFNLFSKFFLRPGIQIIKSKNESVKDFASQNISIPYLMLSRNFSLNERHNWYIGSKFNIINNNQIYNQRISIVLGINRKLKRDNR